MNKRILITGAGGFVGRNLAEYLKEKYSVFPVTHSELELTDESAVKAYINKNDINIILHCADVGCRVSPLYLQRGDQGELAMNSPSPSFNKRGENSVSMLNLKMFYNLVNNLGSSRFMIHFGSAAEYGREHWVPKMKEEYFGTHIPNDDYGFSKYVCASYINDCAKADIVNLRIFSLFGKHDNYQSEFISNAIVRNLLGLPITIDQNAFIDYLYIDDFVKCVEYFINNSSKSEYKPRKNTFSHWTAHWSNNSKLKYRAYNMAKGETIDLVSIAKIINKYAENPSEIIVKIPGLNTEYSGDNSRLFDELKGFNFRSYDDKMISKLRTQDEIKKLNFFSYEDSIQDLYNWYKTNMSSIDREVVCET